MGQDPSVPPADSDEGLTPHPNGTKALAIMRDLGIRASPLNFTLWYEYVCERDPALNATIDALRASGAVFNDRVSQELHARFLGAGSSAAPGAIQKLRRSIDDLSEYIRQSHQQSAAREETIAWLGDEIERNPEADLRNLVARLRAEISDITDGRTAVAERIQAASTQIKTLVGVVGSEVETFMGRNAAFASELSESLATIRAMERSLNQSRLESMTDALTGIANRKHFDETLRTAISHAEATGEPLVLVLVDIDHFKRFNDTHGHVIGDQVLRLVAKELARHVKETDTAARYGGEEFAYILPNVTADQGAEIVERFRQSILKRTLVLRESREKLGQVTLSFGLTAFRSGDTPLSIVQRSDAALYQAKNNGRNRLERL